MSKFEQLSNEILFKIFDYNSLSANDLISLSKVCKRFDHFCCSEENLWESKFEQRWPLAWKKIRSESEKSSVVENWKKGVEDSVKISEELEEIVYSLDHDIYKHENIPSPILKSIFKLLDVGNHAPLTAINELLKIIKENSSESDLTTKYYAQHVQRQVNRYFWSEKLRKFFKLQPERQSLEKGLFYYSNWISSKDVFNVDYEEVSLKFDKLASEVQLHLRTKYPTHPAATMKLLSSDEPLKNSLWPDEMCSQIFESIKHVLKKKRSQNSNENPDIFSNSYLSGIMECSRFVSLFFKVVSHRLGIPLNLINKINKHYRFSEYLLLWKSANSDIFEVMHPFYDDAEWNNFSEENQIQIRQNVYSTKRILQNLAVNVYNYDHYGNESEPFAAAAAAIILNISSLPEDYYLLSKCHVFEFCLDCERHLEVISEICEKLLKMSSQAEDEKDEMRNFAYRTEKLLTIEEKGGNPVNPKNRINGVEMEFATEMTVCQNGMKLPGVIIGWDEKFKYYETPGITDMNCCYKFGKDQPHYFLLFPDGFVVYLLQEGLYTSIKTEESLPIKNDKVGKYFKAFKEKFCIPNEELRLEYPDDEEVIQE